MYIGVPYTIYPFLNLKKSMKKVMLMAIAILFSAATVFAVAGIHTVKLATDSAQKSRKTQLKVIYTCPMHTDKSS